MIDALSYLTRMMYKQLISISIRKVNSAQLDAALQTHLIKMFALLLLFIIILLVIIHVILNHNEKARILRKIPGPEEVFLLANSMQLLVSPPEIFRKMRIIADDYKGIYRFRAPPLSAVNIYNPDDIETVISGTKHNDKSVVYRLLEPWLGDGLLISRGLKWHQRRKILTPAFHFNILNKFCDILGEHSQRLVETLEKTAGEQIDLLPVISEFTLNSICDTAMGTRLNDETTVNGKKYKDAVYKLGSLFIDRSTKAPLHWDFLFNLSSMGRAQKKLLNIVHDFTDNVIEKRKEYLDKNGINIQSYLEDNSNSVFMSSKNKRKIAFLDLLISAEKDGLIDSIGIREEVDTFMFEGHDTTASGLTLCLMLLANHKDIQDKIFAELNSVLGDSMRPATTDELSRMRYLECCIKESLRLYPPVHFIGRRLNETVKLSGYTVPAGVLCHIHIYDLHRRENLFKNPLVFDPERFLPENSVGRHPYAYIPFSAGPRNCIGKRFAMMEMKTALAAVLRRFELCPVTRPSDLQFTTDLVLRNFRPVYIKFVKRSQ